MKTVSRKGTKRYVKAAVILTTKRRRNVRKIKKGRRKR